MNNRTGSGSRRISARGASAHAERTTEERESHRMALDEAWRVQNNTMQNLTKERQRREVLERTNHHLALKLLVMEEQSERRDLAAAAFSRLAVVGSHWLQRMVRHLHDELELAKRQVSGAAPVKDSGLLRALREAEQKLALLQHK